MWGLFHLKIVFWLFVLCGLIAVIHWKKRRIVYQLKEFYFRMRGRSGGPISLNDSFHEDLEAGLSSRNFDIISHNDNDTRSGLDEVSKQEIKRIMEKDNLSFDKARLLFMERKFGQNGIAPDGTPMDPKTVTFGK